MDAILQRLKKGEEPGEVKMEVEEDEEQEDAKAEGPKITARVGGGQNKTGFTLKLTGIKAEMQSSGARKRKELAAATQSAAKKLKTEAPAADQGGNAAAGAAAAKAVKVPTEAEVMAADLHTKRPWRRGIQHSQPGWPFDSDPCDSALCRGRFAPRWRQMRK
jgi:hypothetical protein